MPTVKYIWDGDNIAMEKDEHGATQAVYTHAPGPHGNLISQRRGGQTSYYHYDGLGSTRELTDATETVTDTNMYDAWGVNRESTGTTEYPFRWVGEKGYYTDKELGSVAVRRRVYEPEDGRWRSRDPLGFVDGVNRFVYVRNRPTFAIDPSGMQGKPLGKEGFLKCIRTAFQSAAFRERAKLAMYKYCERCRGTGGTDFDGKACDRNKRAAGVTTLVSREPCEIWTDFCASRIKSCKEAEHVWIHEWSHASNRCLQCHRDRKCISRPNDCEECLCMEMQAYYQSACNGIKKGRKRCVITGARVACSGYCRRESLRDARVEGLYRLCVVSKAWGTLHFPPGDAVTVSDTIAPIASPCASLTIRR